MPKLRSNWRTGAFIGSGSNREGKHSVDVSKSEECAEIQSRIVPKGKAVVARNAEERLENESDSQPKCLGQSHGLGRKLLAEVATIVRPETRAGLKLL